MFTHSVYFWLRDDLSPEATTRFVDGIRSLTTIESVQFGFIGTPAATDREIIDRYWNPGLAAWYPEGKDDRKLTLLKFAAEDGRVWANEGGYFKFAYEVAKANATQTLPDAGGVADVNLN